ncbi:sigma-70 family RNA polymerase sigma factor [Streptomyces ipomoeae]|uniref:RNA polymerase sigma factor n=1 Tax=Streptomyces ipomoeae TaxID=103232 RepID=UPI00215D027A|nr:sigma-70 family RNA polymerase sigma factor [Streptomyces ipomoeae]MDX2827166.1 sigma-70 family RNA polymerase sigma factor [Streptomyces ipomoeae]MDX2879782.1 sigma-70 family RNA polymerase sigma factor [Streptomyces ipomoeae]
MSAGAGPEETGGAVGVPRMLPIDQWPTAWQMAYWGFHQRRRTDYMNYAYLQLGSDADTEEAVDLTFDQVMDRWPQMLQMENLEGYAWTILKRRIADMHRKRRRRPELMETAAFEAALADPSEDPYDTLTEAIALYAAVAALSERQRDAIVLYYGLGFTTAEAAILMGTRKPPSAPRSAPAAGAWPPFSSSAARSAPTGRIPPEHHAAAVRPPHHR